MQTHFMDVSPANRTLAENLRYYMEKFGLTQKGLESKSGVKQTTISLYMRPEDRKPGKDGKPGSAKLTEVEQIAEAFGVPVWELLRPLSPSERAAYAQIEAAFQALSPQSEKAAASLNSNDQSPVRATFQPVFPVVAEPPTKKPTKPKKTENVK